MFNKVIPLSKRLKNEKNRRDRGMRPPRRRPPRPAGRPSALTLALAWGVHLYTALGLAIAAAIAVLLVQGGPGAFRWSFLLMALATFIDGTDGTLARKVRVKEVVPNFDGRKLDDITDFLTYTFLPLLLIWRAQLLPAGTEWALVLPLLASAYGFCQCAAKTDDGFFLGFPSLWNVVAFYLYVLPPDPWVALAVVVVLAFLTFVPSRYLYPSQPGRLNVVHNVLAAGWGLICLWVLWHLPDHDAIRGPEGRGPVRWLTQSSLFYPAFYMGASWVVTVQFWNRGRRARRHVATDLTPPHEPLTSP
jgi:phosphatidylcholine synthase